MLRWIEWPWALLLALVLSLLAVVGLELERRRRTRRLAKFGTSNMLAVMAPRRAGFGIWRTIRLTLAVVLCGVALAGPRWGEGMTAVHSSGVDVALTLDASLSMLAPDAPPTRLDNMKDVVRRLYDMSPNDRFALLAFAGHSYILSPLTTDQSAIELYLTALDPGTVGVTGSSVSSAIHQAVSLLGLQDGGAGRVIVLMSDGETFEPLNDVIAEAKRAAAAGITLVTVGFGTENGSTIPLAAPNGGVTLKHDNAGDVVVTRYTPATLREAAVAAHGIFIPATAPDKAERIRQVMDGLKAHAAVTERESNLMPRFQWFVCPALLLVLLETFLALYPRRWPSPPLRSNTRKDSQ